MNHATIGSHRAPRFALREALRYRVPGQRAWHKGETKNISRSGVLFEGQHQLEPNTPVEMSFLVRSQFSDRAVAVILCAGCVVRTAKPPSGPPALATRIWDYRLLPSEGNRARAEPPSPRRDCSGRVEKDSLLLNV